MRIRFQFVLVILISVFLAVYVLGCRTSGHEEPAPSQEIYPISSEQDSDLEVQASTKRDEFRDNLRKSIRTEPVQTQETRLIDERYLENVVRRMRQSPGDVNEVWDMSKQESDEIAQIVQCLHDFVHKNKNHRDFRRHRIKLNEDMINIHDVEVKSEYRWHMNRWTFNKFNYPKKWPIWELGHWVGDSHWYIIATNGFLIHGGHLTEVCVLIEKKNKNSFKIKDWCVRNLLIN